MSADVSVQWRSLGCGNSSDPHPRSPSLSALPPLPDLIPIRKGSNNGGANSVGVQIKNISGNEVRNLQQTPSQNYVLQNSNSTVVVSDGSKLVPSSSSSLSSSSSSLSSSSFVADTVVSWPREAFTVNGTEILTTSSSLLPLSSSVHGESVQYDNNAGENNNNDDDDNDEGDDVINSHPEHNKTIYDIKLECAESSYTLLSESLHPIPTPINPTEIPAGELCQIDNEIESCENNNGECLVYSNKQSSKEEHSNTGEFILPPPLPSPAPPPPVLVRRTSTRPKNEYKFNSQPLRRSTCATVKRKKQTKRRINNRKTIVNRNKNKISKKGRVYKHSAQFLRKKFLTNNKDNTVDTLSGNNQHSVTTNAAPRINPIFLFVKQEDTRIVEVRCEDYDKRNRIRLTKTANGWRAIPRTDSATSKVSSLLPKVFVTKQERAEAEEARHQKITTTTTTIKQSNSSSDDQDDDDQPLNTWRLNPFFLSDKKSIICPKKEKLEDPLYIGDVAGQEETKIEKHHKKKKKKKKKRKKEYDLKNNVNQNMATQVSIVPKLEFVNIETLENCKIKTSHESLPPPPPSPPPLPSPAQQQHHEQICSATAPNSNQNTPLDSILAVDTELRYANEREDEEQTTTTTPTILPENNVDKKTLSPLHFSSTNVPHQPQKQQQEQLPVSISPNTTIATTKDADVVLTSVTQENDEMQTLEMNTSNINHEKIHQEIETICTVNNSSNNISTNIKENNDDEPSNKAENLGPDSASASAVVYEPYDAKSVCSVEENHSAEIIDISANDNHFIDHQHHHNNHHHQQQQQQQQQQQHQQQQHHEDEHNEHVVVVVNDHHNNHHHQNLHNNHHNQHQHHHHHHHHHNNHHHHQLGDYHDLIEGIPHIQSSHSEDILDHCDNTMTGAELLDSLVERGCEDNHISGEEDVKHTICLSDDYNDDDDILLESQPVVDIISRLGDSLGSSPKCLSFNEAGEIEGLHESLFENSQTDLHHHHHQHHHTGTLGEAVLSPFNRSALEELSMTLKDLEKRATEERDEKQPVESTIVSPDSCQEELPKDLSFKKNNEAVQIMRTSSPRPISRDSDAIQSPQPSGLPAVPPSPDILLHQPHKLLNSKSIFLDLSSPSPKPLDHQQLTQQQ